MRLKSRREMKPEKERPFSMAQARKLLPFSPVLLNVADKVLHEKKKPKKQDRRRMKKLTDDQVRELRSDRSIGRLRILANEFGITVEYARAVRSGWCKRYVI